ncbi:MAG TPA: DUF1553 domain-containing protein [Tepidisphaeraceae bacterium]|nr:DUF1553 domain-containing protein [Tepidisphaeraceae bacterium]
MVCAMAGAVAGLSALVISGGRTPAVAAAPAGGAVQFNRDIRPILAENCLACHGADPGTRKAGLRLDTDAGLFGDRPDNKGKAVVKGKPDESILYKRIVMTDEDDLMPPPKSHKVMTAAQKQTVRKWIEQGAPYEAHWSLIPPTRPAVPKVADGKWVRNPIDAFILAKLEAAGLKPAPEADRRTLARRLALDITGLPAAPDDVEAFVTDKSPNYYEAYVDKLLASPHYGEHRGRYWLDVARYADTHGIHFDNFREMWSYREWVIDAFNRNVPFDQFTMEQLAGDLLPSPTLDQQIATGFNRCNMTTNEGGIIDEEYAVLYTRDRTETVSQVWMGLTTGCAVCHDHKFDPISAKEFYSMAAFFNNTTQAVRDGNIANTPPIIPVPKVEDRARFAEVQKQVKALTEQADARKKAARPDFVAWLKGDRAKEVAASVPTDSLSFHLPLTEGKGTKAAAKVDGKATPLTFSTGYAWTGAKDGRNGLLVQGTGSSPEIAGAGDYDANQPFTVSTWVRNQKRNQTGAILGRMDEASAHRGWDLWLQADRIGFHLIQAWPGDGLKVVSKTSLAPNKWHHVVVAYDGSKKAAGVKVYIDGQPTPVDVEADKLAGTTRTKVGLKIGQRSAAASRVANVGLQDVRLYARALAPREAQGLGSATRIAELIAKPEGKRNEKETDELLGWWLANHDAPTQALDKQLQPLKAEETAIRGRGTIAHIAVEKPTQPEAYILFRGDYDKRREKVSAATPAALPPMPAEFPRNRMGFAKWLLSPEHPLTTRVTVNRMWQEIFGTGLVKTSWDFGIMGELPSHPELLDWLAMEFRDQGWDMKKFIKMIVTSATYRQAAVTTPEKLEKDGANRLLSRGARFRMDGEVIRDQALAASGLLVRKLGGPSVKPYQPTGVWEAVAMIGSNTRDYKQDAGEALYRRSMYTFWKRAAPPASMEVFNAPNRETCTIKRERTNTPLQALVTMNDVQFVEAARMLAEGAIKGAKSFDERLDYATARLIARPMTADERAIVKGTYDELLAHYKASADDAKKLISTGESKRDESLDAAEHAAWTMVVNQLMNLDEVLNK